jgi:antitoxin component of MazEF toxin-antitoxin module
MADFDGKRLVMEPRLKPKYKLAKLLEQCGLQAPVHSDAKLWDELSPEGQEII